MASGILHSFVDILLAISILLIFTTSFVASRREVSSNAVGNGNGTSEVLAIFVFGDSTVDPGNNNYILTATRGDFPPYGHDFVDSEATGRFTNGRLVTDFIASYVGVKEYIPPFLNPTLSLKELKTGVSFASAGCGLDPLTATLSNVIPISKQIEYFRKYRSRMERVLGKREMDHIIEHSLFVLSAGTNDFGINYFAVPVRRTQYTVSEYQQYLLGQLKQIVQELMNLGVKKMLVAGLPPMGCLPLLITAFSEDRFAGRECIESFSAISRDYNEMVKSELSAKAYQSEGFAIVYADIYTPLDLIFQNPKKIGIEEFRKGCCGTGLAEAAFLCNPTSPLCPDTSKYAFFDSIHPSEKTYRILFESFKPLIDSVLKP